MIDSNDLPNINSVDIQSLGNHSLRDAGIGMDVLRLDKIHTIVSGNKWFKLKYYIQDALRFQKKGIITFGGAYSNHIVAVAYACRAVGLRSIGIIRGEAPALYSPTLQEAQRYGMDLRFLSRAEYSIRTLVMHI